MDATTQFEDINHSKKAFEFMRDLYIGDFYNPEAEKESWEDYVRRKQREEQNEMSPMLKLFLVGMFITAFYYIYNFLVENDADK